MPCKDVFRVSRFICSLPFHSSQHSFRFLRFLYSMFVINPCFCFRRTVPFLTYPWTAEMSCHFLLKFRRPFDDAPSPSLGLLHVQHCWQQQRKLSHDIHPLPFLYTLDELASSPSLPPTCAESGVRLGRTAFVIFAGPMKLRFFFPHRGVCLPAQPVRL